MSSRHTASRVTAPAVWTTASLLSLLLISVGILMPTFSG